jgi:hypothetical protein
LPAFSGGPGRTSATSGGAMEAVFSHLRDIYHNMIEDELIFWRDSTGKMVRSAFEFDSETVPREWLLFLN